MNGMESLKTKCQILHEGQSNTRHKYKWGEEQLESALQEGSGGAVWPAASQCEPAGCPGSPEDKPQPGAHQTQHSQPGRTGHCPAVLRAGVASPAVLPAEQWKKDVQVSECFQRRGTKLVKGLEGMACEEWLRTQGLSGLEKRTLRGDTASVCSVLRKEVEREVLISSPWYPVTAM